MKQATNTMTLLTDFMLYYLGYRQLGDLGILRRCSQFASAVVRISLWRYVMCLDYQISRWSWGVALAAIPYAVFG